jgi:hypothetical protein
MKNKFIVFFVLVLIVILIILKSSIKKDNNSLIIGTANPGQITIFNSNENSQKIIKIIDSGYKFVYSVRIGDIYNNGKKYIIAGVSNSFYADPYGCKVLAYDTLGLKESLIDDVGDLRCKDLTIGDADNDGKNEIILATHGEGLVRMYKWVDGKWQKTDLDRNYIGQNDRKEKSNHRVPNDQLPCQTCIIQTAVHIVKIADIDGDGKNEVITTQSSPQELRDKEEVSFINIYRKKGSGWERETVDSLKDREFRSIAIGDVYNNGAKTLVIGVGSPRNEKGSLYSYSYQNGQWKKSVIYDDPNERNMKGLDIGDVYGDGKQRILLATGYPKANIILLSWNGKEFENEKIGSISDLFNNPEAEYNSLVAIIDKKNPKQLFIGGMLNFPKEKIGWEASDKGYVVKYAKNEKDEWTPTIIEDNKNILGMDLEAN